MVSFKTKKLKELHTLGAILSARREERGLTLERAARESNILKDYVEWLETCQYDRLPGEVYARNFIRAYAQFLELNPEEMVAVYRRERNIHHNVGGAVKSRRLFKDPVLFLSRFHFISIPRILRSSLIILIVLLGFTYLGIKVEAIIRSPELEIIYPVEDVLTAEKFIEIKGSTLAAATVTVNGQPVNVSADGIFTETVNLQTGINEVKIIARKDHSRETIAYRRIVVQETAD